MEAKLNDLEQDEEEEDEPLDGEQLSTIYTDASPDKVDK